MKSNDQKKLQVSVCGNEMYEFSIRESLEMPFSYRFKDSMRRFFKTPPPRDPEPSLIITVPFNIGLAEMVGQAQDSRVELELRNNAGQHSLSITIHPLPGWKAMVRRLVR